MAHTQIIKSETTLFCVIFLYNQLSGSLSQKLTLYPFRQSDTNSTCTHGLLHQLDTVVFRCSVDYYENSPQNTLRSKIRKNGNVVGKLIDYNLPRQCFLNSTFFACRLFKDRILLDYNISVAAHVDFNGAVLQAAIYTDNPQDFYSEEQNFPEIYDAKNTTGRLFVNGKELFTNNGSNCETEAIGPYISVLYECRSSATPCVIEISSTGTEESFHGNNVAVYNTNSSVPFDFNVTIKYGLCRLDQHPKTERCRIKVRLGSEASCIQYNCLVEGLFAVVLMFGLWFIMRRRYSFLKHIKIACNYLLQETNNPENCVKFDTEDLEDGEASILGKKNKCTKCKNRIEKYLPLKSLNMDLMPVGYRFEELLQLVKVTFDLTVKIFVINASNRQPSHYSDTVTGKATSLKAGTGIIWNLVKYKRKEKKKNIYCKCQACKHSRNAKKVVGEIRVATTTQVVVNNSEVETATCRISFDRDDNFDVVGYRKDLVYVEGNFIIFTCRTCREDLLDRLEGLRREWVSLFDKVETVLKSKEDGDTFSFMVSHPHGSDKVVSFGHWLHKTVDPGFTKRTKYTYTTASCPGSSGAFVYVLDEYEHVHCGVNCDGINFSSTSNYSSFRSPLKKIHLDN